MKLLKCDIVFDKNLKERRNIEFIGKFEKRELQKRLQ